MVQVNILDAKNRLSELVRLVQQGQPVVLANRGRPVARLVPVQPAGGAVANWLQANPLPAHLRRSAASIDAGIDEARHSWD
jgi:prevent-host-death family protein